MEAVAALAGRTEAVAGEALLHMAIEDGSPFVRREVCRALVEVGPRAVTALETVAREDFSGSVRRAACKALAAIDDPRSTAALGRLQENPEVPLDLRLAIRRLRREARS